MYERRVIKVHACLGLLAKAKILCTDEMRRTLEGMDLDDAYAHLDYYRSDPPAGAHA
jgi:hypothetical protein